MTPSTHELRALRRHGSCGSDGVFPTRAGVDCSSLLLVVHYRGPETHLCFIDLFGQVWLKAAGCCKGRFVWLTLQTEVPRK